jgi:hypothetical protein
MKLLAPPLYVMASMPLDKEGGIDTIYPAIEAISPCITEKRCLLTAEAMYALKYLSVCMYESMYSSIYL